MNPQDLKSTFDNLDIYVFDQLMKGRITKGARILDVGCGKGRNIRYLLDQGYDVSGVDQDKKAIQKVRSVVEQSAPSLLPQFHLANAEQLPFEDHSFDVVLSIAVLHFAKNEEHFNTMLNELMRVLRPGGLFICRLASSTGIESQIQRLEGRRYHLPDGSDRYLVDDALLLELSQKHHLELLDPVKTAVVNGKRAMATWVGRSQYPISNVQYPMSK